jgi:hypothetical protein
MSINRTTTLRRPGCSSQIPTKAKAPTPKVEINLPPNRKIQPKDTTPLTLKSTRTSVSDNGDKSARKVKKIVNGPSLYDRVFTTEILQIGGLVLCSAAVAGAFGTWALKVGALTASQIVATNLIAFIQPGMTVVGFALKAGMFITMNAVVPVATALVTISLPIVSTVVVTTISVLVILHVVNKMIQKLEESLKSGMDTAKELPGKLLEQIPGYSMISSLFGYGKDSPSQEPKVALRQKRQRNPETALRDLATRLEHLDTEVKPLPKNFVQAKKSTGE